MARRGRHAKYRKQHSALTLVLIAFILMVAAYPFVEPHLLEVETVTVTDSSLPSGVGQLRIVYLSDIHQGEWPFFTRGDTKALIQRVNALHPDLILLGGDYADDSDGAIAFFETLPAKFRANYGVYAIVGNHDRTVPESNLAKLRAAMNGAGIRPLVNETASVRIGTSDIYLAAIDDVDNGHPDLKGVASSVRQEDYVIFLSHSPAIIPSSINVADANGHKGWYDLGLFGHTHGGQVAFMGDLLGISHDVGGRYRQGWIVENKINMLISRGVGTSVLPIRLLARPQIHVITVKSR